MKQSTNNYSVLIIEDNPGDQLLLEQSLKSTSLQIDHVTTAETIAEAVSLLKKYSFSIIFLDLFLPDSAGLETFNELVKLNSKIPVIISSGISDTKIAVKAISMGAQDFLIKGEYTTALLEKSVRYATERVLLEEKLAEEKIKKQQEIVAAVITAQAQERAFIGEELHDNINQILATANLYMDCALSDEAARVTLIKESREFIKSAIEEIRKLSKTLLPPSLGETGLQEALHDTVENIKRVNDHIQFSIDWRVPDEQSINDKLKLTIFRIVQEQLNNIFKHAQASNILIRVILEDGVLELDVQDDGIGFDTSKARDGVGLQNIKTRTALLNGMVTINSKPGDGCKLTVIFDTQTSHSVPTEITAAA